MHEKETLKGGRKTVTVNVTLHGGSPGQPLPSARAYLFDRAGRLVDSKPATTDSIRFEVASNQDYRVTVGPDLLTKSKEPPANLAANLAQAKAISHDVLQHVSDPVAIKVNPNIWICWFPTCINVHGTVSKGGLPICVGKVQIFQVDLGCTLDSFTFFDLSAFKIKLLEKLSVSASSFKQVRSAVSSTKSLQRAGTLTTSALKAEAATSSAVSAQSVDAAGSLSEAATTIHALKGAALKQYLVFNKAILFPFWCELIPDSAFCWQELGEVNIQSDGTFSAEICFWCPNDLPDLYFEVIQNIGGTEIEISDPQIACSTYYNYDGSQSVDIAVDDSRAIACLPTGPATGSLYVWPTAIGNIDLSSIDGLETGVGTGLLPGNTPWGGTLPLQMLFHPNLRSNNVMYYRWSYKFDGDADFTPINLPVTHRYMTTVTLPGPIIVIHLNSVNLGPKTIGTTHNLFEIPDPLLPWVDIDDPADRPYAYFDSTGGVTPRRSGMCTLLLEMFDSAGNLVPCNNTLGASTLGDQGGDPAPPGNFTYIFPQIGGPPDTYSNAPTPNITDHGRLIFRIRVDNNNTVAELPRVATPLGTTDTDPCGVLHYATVGDNVELDYVAWHHNNFLDWDLTISRGVSGVVASIPPSPPPTNTSSGSPGSPAAFNNTAGSLLGPCVQAAFAVNLYCAARATNGYGRQSEYDSSATIAFALLHP